MKHLFILAASCLGLSACSTTVNLEEYFKSQSQQTQVQQSALKHNPICVDQYGSQIRCDLSGWQEPQALQNQKPSLGQRMFYSYMNKTSRSPIKLRNKIKSDCSHLGYAPQSSSCYSFAKDTFRQGGYEGYHGGLRAMGYAFGWTKKKLGPSFDSIRDGVWQGKE